MAIETVNLSKSQQAAVESIAQRSRELNQEWVSTDDIDPRPLNTLEAANLIVQLKSDGNRSARLTAAGWQSSGQVSPFHVSRSGSPEPMEAETPDARQSTGKILHGPYPRRETLPPVKSLTGNTAPVLPDPAPPVETQPNPSTPPPPVAVELSTGQIVEDCTDCIHADVLNIVAVMYPEIADTVDILTRAKHIERDLKQRANGSHD